MWKKKSPEKIGSYQFSELYYKKKEEIQEGDQYEFIEFLNWIENVNKWKKKEEGKELVDLRFNKYSKSAILWLFNKFVYFKERKSKWYTYSAILDEAKTAFKTDVYGENIVKPLFWYYGNYLKYLKKKESEAAVKDVVAVKTELADGVKKEEKKKIVNVLKPVDKWTDVVEEEVEVVDEWAINHYWGTDRDVVDENGDVIPNPEQMHIPQDIVVEPEIEREERTAKSWERYIKEKEDKLLEDAKALKEALQAKVWNMENKAIEMWIIIREQMDSEIKRLLSQLMRWEKWDMRLDHLSETTRIVDRLDELLVHRVEMCNSLHDLLSKRDEYVGKLKKAIRILNDARWDETNEMMRVKRFDSNSEDKNDSLRDFIKEWRERLNSSEPNQLDIPFDE